MTATHGAGPDESPHADAICYVCDRPASSAVVADVVHADAGPGRAMYAHQECLDTRRPRQSAALWWLR